MIAGLAAGSGRFWRGAGVGDVRHVRAATAARDKPILGIKTQDHGVDLVNAEYGFAQVRTAVLRFIREVTRG